MRLKIEVRASFSISQNSSSLETLKNIETFFKCGGIRYSKKDNTYKYEIRDFTDLNKVIIPFFKKYPLKSYKKVDFDFFCEICSLISRGLHLNKEGLNLIVEKAYSMNKSGKRKYKKEELLKFLNELKV